MKKRYYIYLIFVFLALLLLWLHWPGANRVPIKIIEGNAKQSSSSRPTESISDDSFVSSEDLKNTPWTGSDEQKRSRISQLREIMNQANRPINFWGKVVDQDNMPLAGVSVKINITHTRELLPGATQDVLDYMNLVTDSEGLFSIENQKGSLLMMEELKKTGYEAPYVGNRPFWYSPPIKTLLFTSNKSQPEIFRMWKLQGAEKMLNKGIGTGIPYDGSAINFDLQTERRVGAGGDVRVTLLRTPLQIKRGQQKYDWIATIEAVDGGVIVTTDEFMYRAPESGYEPKLTISVSAQDPNWSASRAVSFYLKSRGKYARVKADFMTDSERSTTGFEISAYINPTPGHRNLEYNSLQNMAKP